MRSSFEYDVQNGVATPATASTPQPQPQLQQHQFQSGQGRYYRQETSAAQPVQYITYMQNPPPMIGIEEAVWGLVHTGQKKHNTPLGKRLVKAFMAGVLLSTGGVLVDTIAADPWLTANAPGVLKLLQGAIFPVGLVMIVLLQVDLLTGHMAYFIASTLKRKVPIWAFLLDWAIVFIGNLAGSLFFAGLLVYYAGNLAPTMRHGAEYVATAKASPTFPQTLARGVGCNLLVCIAVFQASLARDVASKILATWFPVFVFVSANYSHVIADMFLLPQGMMQGAPVSVGTYIWRVMISAGLGNILGAGLLVLPLLYLYGGEEHNPERPQSDLPLDSTRTNSSHRIDGKDVERDVA
ncbi:unnamed protein product [Sympodiomycopsis kandeliae]